LVLTPDEPEELLDSEPEAPTEEPPPPEPVDEGQPEEGGWAEAGEEWIEEYEEELEPEEPRKPKKPAKERHVFGPVALLVIVLLLILWTFWSPKVMSVTGDMYIGSVTYASLGNETFAMDVGVAADLVDAGHVVWGVSINGSGTAVVGQSAVFRITLSKVAEDPSNFFFRGTAVKLEEVSLFEDDGTFLGTSHGYEETRLAVTASVSVTFDEPGEHDLVVYVRFTVYEVMRLGYLPCKDVELKDIDLDNPIVVS
jgi:hypothetical protein